MAIFEGFTSFVLQSYSEYLEFFLCFAVLWDQFGSLIFKFSTGPFPRRPLAGVLLLPTSGR